MTDFKSSKIPMYTTPINVRSVLVALERKIFDSEENLSEFEQIDDNIIEEHIYNADGIIRAYLVPVYGEAALAKETPYFIGPYRPRANKSGITIRGIVLGANVITEQWLIKFIDDASNYKVTGTFSGAQGTGIRTSDFASSNGDIQIKAADWDLGEATNVDKGLEFIFGTYKTHKTVRVISSQLAASFVIDNYFSDSEDSQSKWGNVLYSRSIALLNKLVDEDSLVSLIEPEKQPGHETWPYAIDEYGRDVANYKDVYGDYSPFI